MKISRLALFIFAFVLFAAINTVYAAPESVGSLTVLPAPVVTNNTVSINWDMDLSGTPPYNFRVYIPSDWYDETDWKAGTGITINGLGALSWADSGVACTDVSIGGTLAYCNEWQAIAGSEFVESIELSFTVLSSAVTGDNRPVRVINTVGSGGTPNVVTTYVTVESEPPPPTTRYVGNTIGDCAGNTPCDTGTSGLANAIAALPVSGGNIIISGQYLSDDTNIGTKNITLQPLNGSSELRGAGSCANGALIVLNSSGNLTIDNLTINGSGAPDPSCEDGISITGSGNLTIQNSSAIDNWPDSGIELLPAGNSDIVVNTSSFNGNDYGLFMNAAGSTVSIDNSSFSNQTNSGLVTLAGPLTVENSSSSSNSDHGIVNNGGTLLARGNTFINNTGYGIRIDSGTTTTYANGFSGNNGGGFQALVQDDNDAAKNWWGSYSDSDVGPTFDESTSYASGWDRRLGAAVESWAASTDNVVLGNAQLNRTGGSTADGVIISFGRSSANAPFGNGVPPYVNLACSPFYDFYALGSATNWQVHLPIDNTPDCNSNVLAYELAYTITDVADCTTVNNTTCWDPISTNDILVSGNTLLIDNLDLSGTHLVSGESSGGLDPTAVNLLDVNIAQHQTTQRLGLAILLLSLVFTGAFVWRRKNHS